MWKNDYKTNVVAATNISHSLFDEKFRFYTNKKKIYGIILW